MVDGYVVTPPGSDFQQWLRANDVPFTVSAFPVPELRRAVPTLMHAWRLARWMKQRRIELIHCNEHNIYPFAQLLRRVARVPVVCHVRYQVGRDYAKWAFGGRREPDALLWTSQQQRDDCAEAIRGVVPAHKQHLIPLGVDPTVFGARADLRDRVRRDWGVADDEIVLGQACALRARKRLHDFVDLVAALSNERTGTVGVLAGDAMPGDEDYKAAILRHIDERRLGRRFRWLGNVDDVEMFDQAIDVFVSTSEYETFGNSVCEAMACGRPVLAYRGGSIREVVGDAGLVVPDGDLDALVVAARRIVADAPLRRALGERAAARVREEFSPAATLKRLTGIYERLTAN